MAPLKSVKEILEDASVEEILAYEQAKKWECFLMGRGVRHGYAAKGAGDRVRGPVRYLQQVRHSASENRRVHSGHARGIEEGTYGLALMERERLLGFQRVAIRQDVEARAEYQKGGVPSGVNGHNLLPRLLPLEHADIEEITLRSILILWLGAWTQTRRSLNMSMIWSPC
jgi:hypothetical protein